jgi:hypothetical protein
MREEIWWENYFGKSDGRGDENDNMLIYIL